MKVEKVESAAENYTTGAEGRISAKYAAKAEDGTVVAWFRPAGAHHRGSKSRLPGRVILADPTDRALRWSLRNVSSLADFRAWAEKQV
jgi:hypothetical protein